MASLFVLHNRLVAAEDAVVDVTVVDRACCLNRKMRPTARVIRFSISGAGIRTIDPASQTLLALKRHSAAPLGRKATDLAALSALAVILAGDLKVAHVRLCHSRMMFVRAYPRETQEMVFDAHERAFAFFKGACGRGIYDNMKTAVETIFVGKDRQYNRRFLQMCSHHLVEPVACTPASGWEKGQVENQVGLVRERFFTPRLRFKSYH